MRLTEAQRRDALIAAAAGLYRDAEQTARNSYALYGRIFNDKVWREADPDGFRLALRVRRALSAYPAGRAALDKRGGE